jgi:hypothetical protein
LYIDDEESFDYQAGKYALRRFTFKAGLMTGSSPTEIPVGFGAANNIERIIVIGMQSPPQKITLKSGNSPLQNLSYEFDTKKKTLTIRKPEILVTMDFEISFL